MIPKTIIMKNIRRTMTIAWITIRITNMLRKKTKSFLIKQGWIVTEVKWWLLTSANEILSEISGVAT